MEFGIIYGTSIPKSFPEKEKLGRLRPFINLAAVCDRAVTIIGNAIDGSDGTYAVVALLRSLPNVCVWLPTNDGVRMSSGTESVVIETAYLCPRGVERVI